MQCTFPANWGDIALQEATLEGTLQTHPDCFSGLVGGRYQSPFFFNSDWNWWNPQHSVTPGHCPDIPWIENVSELPVTSLLPSSEVSTWSWAYCFTLVWMGHYLLMISWKHAKRTQEQKKEKAVCKKMLMEMSVVLPRTTRLQLFSVTTNRINVMPVSFLLANHYLHLSQSTKHIRGQGKDKDISHCASVVIISPKHFLWWWKDGLNGSPLPGFVFSVNLL